ncbi:MAG: zinc/iron-chelating domain-containing protein [Nitrospinae bacterium CG11_big_fil_rev_8_21_14_0_20_56_8]|nr:MAG: zinc/iron-chelating domain-containing protein [Nitrospinae bacterium CG11_big_fil_rev_8_21_14_0_20_56_8]
MPLYSDRLGMFIQGMTRGDELIQYLKTKYTDRQIQDAYESRVEEAKDLARAEDITPLQAFWKLLDRTFEKAVPPRTCQRGCGHCCYQAVAITQLEWDGILARVKKDGIDLDRIIERSRKSIDRVRGVLEAHKSLEQVDWHQLVINQPCPFLEEDHSCAVYEDRPLDCRMVVAFRGVCESKKLEHAQRGVVVEEAIGSTVIAKLQHDQTPKFKRRKFTGNQPLKLLQHWLLVWQSKSRKKK